MTRCSSTRKSLRYAALSRRPRRVRCSRVEHSLALTTSTRRRCRAPHLQRPLRSKQRRAGPVTGHHTAGPASAHFAVTPFALHNSVFTNHLVVIRIRVVKSPYSPIAKLADACSAVRTGPLRWTAVNVKILRLPRRSRRTSPVGLGVRQMSADKRRSQCVPPRALFSVAFSIQGFVFETVYFATRAEAEAHFVSFSGRSSTRRKTKQPAQTGAPERSDDHRSGSCCRPIPSRTGDPKKGTGADRSPGIEGVPALDDGEAKGSVRLRSDARGRSRKPKRS